MPKKIMIIDDDIDLVEAMRITLETDDYEVIDAQDGQKGLHGKVQSTSLRPHQKGCGLSPRHQLLFAPVKEKVQSQGQKGNQGDAGNKGVAADVHECELAAGRGADRGAFRAS